MTIKELQNFIDKSLFIDVSWTDEAIIYRESLREEISKLKK